MNQRRRINFNQFLIESNLIDNGLAYKRSNNFAIVKLSDNNPYVLISYYYKLLKNNILFCSFGFLNQNPYVIVYGLDKDNGSLKGILRKLCKEDSRLRVFHSENDIVSSIRYRKQSNIIKSSYLIDKFINNKVHYVFGGVLSALKYKKDEKI